MPVSGGPLSRPAGGANRFPVGSACLFYATPPPDVSPEIGEPWPVTRRHRRSAANVAHGLTLDDADNRVVLLMLAVVGRAEASGGSLAR